MAWYTSHEIHFKGRLLQIMTRYGCFQSARVLKGRPLDLSCDSKDWHRLRRLVERNHRIGCEIQDFMRALDDHCNR